MDIVLRGVDSPTAVNDATNKDYVDRNVADVREALKTYLPLSGGTMNGKIDMNFQSSMINLSNPSNNFDAANKFYVDNAVSSATRPFGRARLDTNNVTITATGLTLDQTQDQSVFNNIDRTQAQMDMNLLFKTGDTGISWPATVFPITLQIGNVNDNGTIYPTTARLVTNPLTSATSTTIYLRAANLNGTDVGLGAYYDFTIPANTSVLIGCTYYLTGQPPVSKKG